MADFDEHSAQTGTTNGLHEKIRLAEPGDTSLLNELGMLYLNGNGMAEPNQEKAFYWFHRLAETGESSGMLNIGFF